MIWPSPVKCSPCCRYSRLRGYPCPPYLIFSHCVVLRRLLFGKRILCLTALASRFRESKLGRGRVPCSICRCTNAHWYGLSACSPKESEASQKVTLPPPSFFYPNTLPSLLLRRHDIPSLSSSAMDMIESYATCRSDGSGILV